MAAIVSSWKTFLPDMIPEDEYTRKKAINLIIICSCLLFHVFANCFEIVLVFFPYLIE